jgi:excisionase family DNA binding protein
MHQHSQVHQQRTIMMSFSSSDTKAAASGGEGRGHRRDQIKFYTIAQIADCVEASTRTVRRWIENKLLIAHKIDGLVRISEADFQAFLATHRHP